MIRCQRVLLLFLFLASLSACTRDPDEALAARSNRVFGVLPEAMPGSDVDTRAMIGIGRQLFHSTELSLNRTQSCATCHRLDSAGVDALSRSPGALGVPGSRNTPTVLNAGLQKVQFWDGRAGTLEEQAIGPILNPVEMAMPSEEAVVVRLRESGLRATFEKAFPGDPDPLRMENVTTAIAAFERTLISSDRFDAFQNGKHDVLTAEEKRGLRIFMKTGCASCHNGPLLGGHLFQKIGIVHPYGNETDPGLAALTNRPRDRFVFKVPSLRNVALTGPYFHDGAVATLPEAVEQMAWLQLGIRIPRVERDAIVAFLGTLSDRGSGLGTRDSRLGTRVLREAEGRSSSRDVLRYRPHRRSVHVTAPTHSPIPHPRLPDP